MSSQAATRIAIFHRHRLFREGLAAALTHQEDLWVVASVSNLVDLLRDRPVPPPDVFLLDLCTPTREGLSHAREVRASFPQSKILMIGVAEIDSDLIASVEAGALGCLPEEASLPDLIHNIRAIMAGEAVCSPRLTRLLLHRVAQTAAEALVRRLAALPRLTSREREIVALIELGQANKEIATQLRISPQTVKNHVHNILDKLQLDTRRDAVRYARDQGLLPTPPL
jgi:DNA-binding NarL/FixJ family response regulator